MTPENQQSAPMTYSSQRSSLAMPLIFRHWRILLDLFMGPVFIGVAFDYLHRQHAILASFFLLCSVVSVYQAITQIVCNSRLR
jgi:hypothetical protein